MTRIVTWRRRWLLWSSLALAACGGAGHTAAPSIPPESGGATETIFDVRYSEAANVFEILDNLSNWWSGKCDPEYREYWKQRFGITPDDDLRFAAYKQIRKRYYADRAPSDPEPTKSTHGLFARLKPPDRFAEAFYGAAGLDAAFVALAEVVDTADLQALKAFFEAYRARYEILLEESRAYPEIAAALQGKLNHPRTVEYYRRLAQFYGVTGTPRFTVVYAWWPPVAHVAANNRGRFLILKYNPISHRDSALRDVDIPVHELVHHISAHVPEDRKRELTRTFLAGCDPTAGVAPVRILEEPLAVAHQKCFLSLADPQRLDLSKPWYGGDPWVSAFSKLIFPSVARGHEARRTLDASFVEQIARLCAQLKAQPRED